MSKTLELEDEFRSAEIVSAVQGWEVWKELAQRQDLDPDSLQIEVWRGGTEFVELRGVQQLGDTEEVCIVAKVQRRRAREEAEEGGEGEREPKRPRVDQAASIQGAGSKQLAALFQEFSLDLDAAVSKIFAVRGVSGNGGGVDLRFVGRDDELKRMFKGVTAADWPRTQMTCAVGGPGSGKTRLACEFAKSINGVRRCGGARPAWFELPRGVEQLVCVPVSFNDATPFIETDEDDRGAEFSVAVRLRYVMHGLSMKFKDFLRQCAQRHTDPALGLTNTLDALGTCLKLGEKGRLVLVIDEVLRVRTERNPNKPSELRRCVCQEADSHRKFQLRVAFVSLGTNLMLEEREGGFGLAKKESLKMVSGSNRSVELVPLPQLADEDVGELLDLDPALQRFKHLLVQYTAGVPRVVEFLKQELADLKADAEALMSTRVKGSVRRVLTETGVRYCRQYGLPGVSRDVLGPVLRGYRVYCHHAVREGSCSWDDLVIGGVVQMSNQRGRTFVPVIPPAALAYSVVWGDIFVSEGLPKVFMPREDFRSEDFEELYANWEVLRSCIPELGRSEGTTLATLFPGVWSNKSQHPLHEEQVVFDELLLRKIDWGEHDRKKGAAAELVREVVDQSSPGRVLLLPENFPDQDNKVDALMILERINGGKLLVAVQLKFAQDVGNPLATLRENIPKLDELFEGFDVVPVYLLPDHTEVRSGALQDFADAHPRSAVVLVKQHMVDAFGPVFPRLLDNVAGTYGTGKEAPQ